MVNAMEIEISSKSVWDSAHFQKLKAIETRDVSLCSAGVNKYDDKDEHDMNTHIHTEKHDYRWKNFSYFFIGELWNNGWLRFWLTSWTQLGEMTFFWKYFAIGQGYKMGIHSFFSEC